MGAFLRNITSHGNEDDITSRLARTIYQFSKYLELDQQRIIKWGFAQSVLSAWWRYEDNERFWEASLAWAKRFERIGQL